ncbi:hypothetical protein [Pseudomonas sp. dw_612]|uniref:hypothetical protein n=1 Tax=Pseudomonas sp. dw_612 TaxID=2720080 RepID=UPI001BD66E58|nr:hypothetical protein [Pseudomonas sp. dw_612]
MKKIMALLIALIISGCATYSPIEGPGRYTSADSGPDIVRHLTNRYNDRASMCRNSPSAPAFLCSGVLIRGTSYSTEYHVWDPNPAGNGVSFSYLRTDAKYDNLAYDYNTGFIFYPIFYAPAGKFDPEILCFFPVDGATSNRPDQGCGQTPGIIASRECQAQGINTAAQYVAHFNASPSKYQYLCGFNVRDELNAGATTAFNEGIKAEGLVGTYAFKTQNEIRMAKWAPNLGTTVPIEAFFYLNDTGKVGAQYNQRDFKTQTGIWVPMIKLTLPQTPASDAVFQFIAADQAISS